MTGSYLILRAIAAVHEINALREVFCQRVGKFRLISIIALLCCSGFMEMNDTLLNRHSSDVCTQNHVMMLVILNWSFLLMHKVFLALNLSETKLRNCFW